MAVPEPEPVVAAPEPVVAVPVAAVPEPEPEPSILLAVHLFALGLAIGCLVSMLNATIQNRTTKHSNGAVMSFTILIRTAALWLGYNFYQLIVDAHMSQRMGGIVEEWNAVLSFDLPSNSALANMLMTPFGDALRLIPGITNDISMQVVAIGFIIGVIQDSCEIALNSSSDALFTATAEYMQWAKEGRKFTMGKDAPKTETANQGADI